MLELICQTYELKINMRSVKHKDPIERAQPTLLIISKANVRVPGSDPPWPEKSCVQQPTENNKAFIVLRNECIQYNHFNSFNFKHVS